MIGNRTGPFVATAVFCENVIEDKSGVLSLIRIIDRFTITAQGPDVSERLPAGQVNMMCVITLKSGEAKGRHKLEIVPWLPSGQRQDVLVSIPLNLEGGDKGQNVVMNLQYGVEQEGTHWFEVILNEDQILTRMPLTVVYQPMQTRST